MKSPLVLVVIALLIGFVAQVVVWRLLRPKRYLVWIPVIFACAGTSVLLLARGFSSSTSIAVADDQLVAAGMLFGLIAVCYTGGFAGVVEYSPSAEILRAVSAEPAGVRLEDLRVDTLSESALTGKRIRHLLRNHMIVEDESGQVCLTPAGRQVVEGCLAYRRLFGLTQRASG